MDAAADVAATMEVVAVAAAVDAAECRPAATTTHLILKV